MSEDDFKVNVTRLGIVLGVIATIAALAGAWFVLPYRMEAAERVQTTFEAKVERRFELTEAEARQQREILIRIDENVKELRRNQRSNREP